MLKLPKLEDFKAPWENHLKEGEDPNEVEIDRDKLKRYIHGVLSDKEKAQEKVEEITTERDTLKTQLEEKAAEGESETDKLKRKLAAAEAKAKKAEEPDIEKLQLEVAVEKGLTKTQAKRLVGKNLEEMSADADELLKEFGAAKADDDEDGGDDVGLRVTPRTKLKNPGDPAGESRDWDPDKMADQYFASSGGF